MELDIIRQQLQDLVPLMKVMLEVLDFLLVVSIHLEEEVVQHKLVKMVMVLQVDQMEVTVYLYL